jgi:hypothetical protein
MSRREPVLSLKDFHLVFISCSALCCLTLAYWGFRQYQTESGIGYALVALMSLLIAMGLAVYEIYFVRKIKV